jgi:hypothetical protein
VLNVRSQIFVEEVRAKGNAAFHAQSRPGNGRGYDDENDDEHNAEDNVEDNVEDEIEDAIQDDIGDNIEDMEDEVKPGALGSSSYKNISTIDPKTKRDSLYKGILSIGMARLVEANCLQSIVFISQQSLRREE